MHRFGDGIGYLDQNSLSAGGGVSCQNERPFKDAVHLLPLKGIARFLEMQGTLEREKHSQQDAVYTRDCCNLLSKSFTLKKNLFIRDI